MKVQGKNINFRSVEESDAAFILGLRLDATKSRFISKVLDDLEQRLLWSGADR